MAAAGTARTPGGGGAARTTRTTRAARAALPLVALFLCTLGFAFIQVASASASDSGLLCTSSARFQHVSPILCPVAKTRLCWNITHPDDGGAGSARSVLTLRIEAKVEGWISVALMDPSLVGFADAILVYVDDQGDPKAVDMHIGNYAQGKHGSVITDSDQNVEVVGGGLVEVSDTTADGHEAGKYTAVTVQRKFDTGDRDGDVVLAGGQETGIIWATANKEKPQTSEEEREQASNNETASDGTLGSQKSVSVSEFPSHWYPLGNKGAWRVTFDNSVNALTCAYYCALQINACGNADEAEHQFITESSCLARCDKYVSEGAWPTGSLISDHSVNSLACRINQAHQAENAPRESDAIRQELCDNSGTVGNNVCGTVCENYCAHVVRACRGLFPSEEACLQECSFPPSPSENRTTSKCSSSDGQEVSDPRRGSANFPFYDTFSCRAIQASLGYTNFADSSGNSIPSFVQTGPAYRCPMALDDSAACCDSARPTCEYYCQSVMTSCSGSREQFDGSVDECNDWCANALGSGNVDRGTLEDTSGRTLGCLTYLGQHATSDELCTAAKLGGSVCGERMEPEAITDSDGDGDGEPDEGGCQGCLFASVTIEDTTVSDFDSDAFVAQVSSALDVGREQVEVISIKAGSVIVDFRLVPETDTNFDESEVVYIQDQLRSGTLGSLNELTYYDSGASVLSATSGSDGNEEKGSAGGDGSNKNVIIIGIAASAAGLVLLTSVLAVIFYRRSKSRRLTRRERLVDLVSTS